MGKIKGVRESTVNLEHFGKTHGILFAPVENSKDSESRDTGYCNLSKLASHILISDIGTGKFPVGQGTKTKAQGI